ncbi:MAG: hypothetical protein NC420_11215 [Eubacterium sp.]|nr:hypothetical protein [Eubacterium sp.]
MIRLFEQHQIRKVKELDGMWDFVMEGANKRYRMPVPGCWEQHPDFLAHRGKGCYSREVYVEKDGNLRLEFKGVSHTADVFWDGEKVAHHYNAFTCFSTVIRQVKAGRHRIDVRVDNTFGEYSALHVPNDYYTYGGITRPVAVESLPDVYIKEVHFTSACTDGAWSAKVEVTLCNLSEKDVTVTLDSSLEPWHGCVEGQEQEKPMKAGVYPETVIPARGEVTMLSESSFPGVRPWSHQAPCLYLLRTTLSLDDNPVDDLIDRVGFRTVEVKGTRLLLNGQPVYLKGFNRHEDYAVEGCAISLQHMVQDMDLMQDMNVNALRTCHYPNDERFLDLCDERGIMVWEENHARGFDLQKMQNPNFEKQCEDCIREMIRSHYNHPAIVIWGILNECASEEPEAREMYRKQYEQIRSLDATRPTTSATCRHFKDICLDLPDVVSFNMYSGWYQDCDIAERNDREIEWIRSAGGQDKPIIVSELGAASIYGYRDRSRCKWSEERQADLIRDSLEIYMNDENITGVFIWQFADCRVTEEDGWFSSRARCHNNKGVVDEYRRPKEAYDVVKEMFAKYGTPTVPNVTKN